MKVKCIVCDKTPNRKEEQEHNFSRDTVIENATVETCSCGSRYFSYSKLGPLMDLLRSSPSGKKRVRFENDEWCLVSLDGVELEHQTE